MFKRKSKNDNRPKKNSRAVILVISDMHAGFQLGLLNPDTMIHEQLPDGSFIKVKARPNELQITLWNWYLHFLERAKEIADGCPIVLIHNGDITHGNRFMTELISTRMADQTTVAVANLEPILSLPRVVSLRMVVGTGLHEFGEASSCIQVSEAVQLKHPGLDIQIVKHGLANIEGVPVDYAHHGPHPGTRYVLAGNTARLHLHSYMLHDFVRTGRVTRLYIRSHYHQPVRVDDNLLIGDQFYDSTLIVTPALCVSSYQASKVTKGESDIVYIGMEAIEIEGGLLREIHPLFHELDLRTKEVISVN